MVRCGISRPLLCNGFSSMAFVIEHRKPLKVYEVVAVFDVAYGLPMLLLASVAGVLAAKLGSRPPI